MRKHIFATGALGLAALHLGGCRLIGGSDELRFDLLDPASVHEICDNGVDDDDDGLVDCADPDCGGEDFSCVPVPEGWNGPVGYREGEGAPDACPSGYPLLAQQGGTGLHAGPATCAACSCDPATVTCSPAPVETFTKSGCQPPTKQTATTSGQCAPLPGSVDSLRQDAATVTADACAPSGGDASRPGLTWDRRGRACKSDTASVRCGPDAACAPPTDASWSLCVWRSEDVECPSGYPRRTLLTQAADDRGCTPCACGAPAAAACSVTTTLFDTPDCQGISLGALATDGACVSRSDVLAVLVTVDATATAACDASGGVPTGAAVETPVATICCAG